MSKRTNRAAQKVIDDAVKQTVVGEGYMPWTCKEYCSPEVKAWMESQAVIDDALVAQITTGRYNYSNHPLVEKASPEVFDKMLACFDYLYMNGVCLHYVYESLLNSGLKPKKETLIKTLVRAIEKDCYNFVEKISQFVSEQDAMSVLDCIAQTDKKPKPYIILNLLRNCKKEQPVPEQQKEQPVPEQQKEQSVPNKQCTLFKRIKDFFGRGPER